MVARHWRDDGGGGGIVDERLRAFAAYVMAHPGVAVTDAAERFGVSDRSVRDYRKRANYDLAGAAEIVLSRGHLRVEVTDGARLRTLIAPGAADAREVVDDGEDGLPLELSSQAWEVAGAMVDAVEAAFSYEFADDLELRMNLARHVEPLGVRLKAGEEVENPLLGDVKSRYPLAFAMAAHTSEILDDAYGAKPSDDELGYVALAFALALERGRERAPRKNIVVVCATGHTSARMLEHRIRSEFGPQLGRVELCDKDDLLFRDLSHVDYVFTTVPIDASLPVPTVTISYFFNDVEADRVRDLLGNEGDVDLRPFFPRDLFFGHLSAGTKAEALHSLCEAARAAGYVDEVFEDAVWDREQAASTAFGGGIAIPHPMGHQSPKTFVAVGLLKEPVLWDESGERVQAVFLVGFGAGDGDRFEALFGRLSAFLTDHGAMAALLGERTFSALARGLSSPRPR